MGDKSEPGQPRRLPVRPRIPPRLAHRDRDRSSSLPGRSRPAHRQVILGYQSYHSDRHVSLALFNFISSSWTFLLPLVEAYRAGLAPCFGAWHGACLQCYLYLGRQLLAGCKMELARRRTNASTAMHACIVCYPCIQNLSSLSPFLENIFKIMSTPDMLHQIRSACCIIKLINKVQKQKQKSILTPFNFYDISIFPFIYKPTSLIKPLTFKIVCVFYTWMVILCDVISAERVQLIVLENLYN